MPSWGLGQRREYASRVSVAHLWPSRACTTVTGSPWRTGRLTVLTPIAAMKQSPIGDWRAEVSVASRGKSPRQLHPAAGRAICTEPKLLRPQCEGMAWAASKAFAKSRCDGWRFRLPFNKKSQVSPSSQQRHITRSAGGDHSNPAFSFDPPRSTSGFEALANCGQFRNRQRVAPPEIRCPQVTLLNASPR